MDKPEKVLESDDCNILWDFPIQKEKCFEHNRPDIMSLISKIKGANERCPKELNFEGLEIQKLNIPTDKTEKVDEKMGSFD